MKKYILALFISLFMLPDTEAASVSVSTKTTISETVLDSKVVIKRRRKKGFLWGLFKKKDCGCPKH
jgi:hypothetical protein